jgi:conjugative relaxase-like TrwC/TraI family protein
MLGVHRLTSNRADYYLSDLAQELPLPLAPEQGRGVWIGQAAEGLHLRGAVDPTQFRAVLEGRHPDVGRRLRSDRATVLGFDLTFSAPKSASILFALGGEEVARQVMAAHTQAVGGAVAYMEAHGVSANRRLGEHREVVPTTGMVAASFTHGVNRNLDPHLHSHIVLANLVHGQDGRWSACDWRGIAAHREAADAVYGSEMRAGLTARFGVHWTQAPQARAEVSGISPLLLGEFSSRSADIRRHMSEVGAHSAWGNHIAWAVTRPPKQNGLRFTELSAQWERRSLAVGVERSELAGVFGPRRHERQSFNEHQFASVLSTTPDGGARRRNVTAAFGVAARDGASAHVLEQLTDLWVPLPRHSQVGVSESVHQRRAVVPAGYLLRTLGPRPVDPADHMVWRDAARCIVDYRQRWGVTRSSDALGVEATSSGLSSLATTRLVDHLRTVQYVETARARLGQREPPVMALDRGR